MPGSPRKPKFLLLETEDKAGAGERKKSDNGNDYGGSGSVVVGVAVVVMREVY